MALFEKWEQLRDICKLLWLKLHHALHLKRQTLGSVHDLEFDKAMILDGDYGNFLINKSSHVEKDHYFSRFLIHKFDISPLFYTLGHVFMKLPPFYEKIIWHLFIWAEREVTELCASFSCMWIGPAITKNIRHKPKLRNLHFDISNCYDHRIWTFHPP